MASAIITNKNFKISESPQSRNTDLPVVSDAIKHELNVVPINSKPKM